MEKIIAPEWIAPENIAPTKTIRFKPNNIPYYQDMKLHCGIPNGIDFEVELGDKRTTAILRAHCYGSRKAFESYGNGAIRVSKSMFANLIDMCGGWRDETREARDEWAAREEWVGGLEGGGCEE